MISNDFRFSTPRSHHKLDFLPLFQANSLVHLSGWALLCLQALPCSQSCRGQTILLSVPFLGEVKFTQHKCNHFKVNDSVAFSIFTMLCNHHLCLYQHPPKFYFLNSSIPKEFSFVFLLCFPGKVTFFLVLPVLGLFLQDNRSGSVLFFHCNMSTTQTQVGMTM